MGSKHSFNWNEWKKEIFLCVNMKLSNFYYVRGVFSTGQYSASIFLQNIFIMAYLFQGNFIANRFSVTPMYLLQKYLNIHFVFRVSLHRELFQNWFDDKLQLFLICAVVYVLFQGLRLSFMHCVILGVLNVWLRSLYIYI